MNKNINNIKKLIKIKKFISTKALLSILTLKGHLKKNELNKKRILFFKVFFCFYLKTKYKVIRLITLTPLVVKYTSSIKILMIKDRSKKW